MAFDLSTAKPVSEASSGGFDLSTAKPDVPKQSDGMIDTAINGIKGLGMGAAKGLGGIALGAQRLVGKGLESAASSVSPLPSIADVVAGKKEGSDTLVGRAGKWLSDDADSGRAKLDAELAPYKEASPIATGVGEVGGEIVATLPVGGLIGKGIGSMVGGKAIVGAVPRAAQAAALGAGYGGVTGVARSSADTLGGTLADGATGAATGAVLSGVASPVVSALGAIGGNIAQRASKTSAAEYAKQKVAEAFARDARGTLAQNGTTNPLAQVAARMGKLGDEATIADAGGRNANQLLDTLATLPGRTKDMAYNLLRNRTAGVGGRLRDSAESAMNTQGQRLGSTVESLIERRQQDSAPLYNALRATDIQPSQELAKIVAAADDLGAVKLGREIATARQQPFSIDAQQPSQWNMGDLDHVKQGLDQLLSSRKALNADGSLTPVGAAYQALKTKLVGELDGATMNAQTGASLYARARNAFAGPSAMIDAANAGKAAINRDESSILNTVKGMSDNELQAFRIGAFEGLRGKLGTQGGQTQILNMWKNPGMQEKLKAMFGTERAYREFAANAASEARLKGLQSVGTGSQTAARQAGMGDLDASALSDAGAVITGAKSGNLLMAAGAAKNAWNRVATPQAVRDQMGSLLLSQGQAGQRTLTGLDGLIQQINNRNLLLSNRVGITASQAGGRLTIDSNPRTNQLNPRDSQ